MNKQSIKLLHSLLCLKLQRLQIQLIEYFYLQTNGSFTILNLIFLIRIINVGLDDILKDKILIDKLNRLVRHSYTDIEAQDIITIYVTDNNLSQTITKEEIENFFRSKEWKTIIPRRDDNNPYKRNLKVDISNIDLNAEIVEKSGRHIHRSKSQRREKENNENLYTRDNIILPTAETSFDNDFRQIIRSVVNSTAIFIKAKDPEIINIFIQNVVEYFDSEKLTLLEIIDHLLKYGLKMDEPSLSRLISKIEEQILELSWKLAKPENYQELLNDTAESMLSIKPSISIINYLLNNTEMNWERKATENNEYPGFWKKEFDSEKKIHPMKSPFEIVNNLTLEPDNQILIQIKEFKNENNKMEDIVKKIPSNPRHSRIEIKLILYEFQRKLFKAINDAEKSKLINRNHYNLRKIGILRKENTVVFYKLLHQTFLEFSYFDFFNERIEIHNDVKSEIQNKIFIGFDKTDIVNSVKKYFGNKDKAQACVEEFIKIFQNIIIREEENGRG